ncbi:hypothetical protein PP728_24540, partial [Ralstonia solanacearum]|nr:hypothetical protein [Ralstonia solanacearum]MCL9850623.1 hypothetical protein [Ralstonia solanacearum]MCL9855919.1 hypothetical protein [Ralstonia solanacearum]MCL9865616.1 hypothetical protein [Ralstonia solanacearum]MCL9870323.1 hypothetical protein [Ralstonia solanacearum]
GKSRHPLPGGSGLLRRVGQFYIGANTQQPFIWNATHLSERMRQKTLDLLFAYHAEVEITYLEQPRAELLRRNTKRDTSLSNKALESMLHRWAVPLPTEAHHVRYVV